MALHLDYIQGAGSCQERDGVVQRLVRIARITGLSNTDHQALFAALAAVGLVNGSTPAGSVGSNLRLRERNARIVDKDTVDVELVYEHALSPGQDLDFPPYGLLVGSARSVIAQVRTNRDVNGDPISLEHTYPDTDPDFAGQTRPQGGEIEYFQPQTTITYKGVRTTSYPWLMESFLVGKVNANAWAGRGPREWMCVSCAWQPVDGVNGRYSFEIEFQHNPDTWDPTAVFIDERTNKPPPNLVAGTGYKTIQKAIGVDFESVLGVRIQGS